MGENLRGLFFFSMNRGMGYAKVPDSAGECRTNINQLTEQQAAVYRQIVDEGSITSSEVEI